MKLVADEGVERAVVEALRADGHKVYWFAEEAPGSDDDAILMQAKRMRRLILTNDKDFGELVYRLRLPTYGVMLLRLSDLTSSDKARLVCQIIETRGDELPSSFSVLTSKTLRIRSRLRRE